MAIAFSSCRPSESDRMEFRDYYFFRVSEIVDYNQQVESGGEIHINDWMVFLENCSYLETLTGYKLGYIDGEPPFYEKQSQLTLDTIKLSNWYRQNGGEWTMQKADKYVYKKRRGHTVFF